MKHKHLEKNKLSGTLGHNRQKTLTCSKRDLKLRIIIYNRNCSVIQTDRAWGVNASVLVEPSQDLLVPDKTVFLVDDPIQCH